MTAADILKLIETVSPDDTAMLDEIDARVWCYMTGHEFASFHVPAGEKRRRHTYETITAIVPDKNMVSGNNDPWWYELEDEYGCTSKRGETYKDLIVQKDGSGILVYPKKYTSSRDVLKAIRPKDQWLFGLGHTGECWFAQLFTVTGAPFSNDAVSHTFEGRHDTEELAELHAIIQAIEFERNKK